jgi:hypothetical protein
MAKGTVMKRISIKKQNHFNAEEEIFLAFRMIIMMKNKIVPNEQSRNLVQRVELLICIRSVPGSNISRDPYVPNVRSLYRLSSAIQYLTTPTCTDSLCSISNTAVSP